MKFIYDTAKYSLSDNAFKILAFKKEVEPQLLYGEELGVDYISDKLGKSISTVRRGLRELK
jgi:predicted transcriptional regulator